MSLIPSFWVAAARWSARLDLRPVLRTHGAAALVAARPGQLLRLGLPPAFVTTCERAEPQPFEGPWAVVGGAGYPERLLELTKPPPVVFFRGRVELLQRPAVTVVGSRSCTAYGRRHASQLGAAIAQAGGVLVSGAARGIDTAAHDAALDRGDSVAVLGAGLDHPPAASARSLLARLAARGLLVSELPPLDPPSRRTFPRRNRLLAALGRATVVVEAARRSGALITARYAAELGRDVFAVPGPLDAPASAGTLDLLEGGASLYRSPAGVLGLLDRQASPSARVLHALAEGPASPTQLALALDLPDRDARTVLSLLELTGTVRRLADQRYALR